MNLLYVILRHEGVSEPHFDLMFETAAGSQLLTWRSPCWPIVDPTVLQKLRDHRRAYLDFEGAIPGDRGIVQRIASGKCFVSGGANSSYFIQLDDGKQLTIRCNGGEWVAGSNSA